MTTKYLVKKVETCPECNGDGSVQLAHCGLSLCNYVLSEEEMIALDNKDHLPCGHRITHLREEEWCAECEGTGRIETDVDLAEALDALDNA